MGVLRILGRNWCPDDVAEATMMRESTVRLSFHSFMENFVDAYYEDYINRPKGAKLNNSCKGKEGYPTLIYSVTVDHSRRIHK
jgi:hypothetical protein